MVYIINIINNIKTFIKLYQYIILFVSQIIEIKYKILRHKVNWNRLTCQEKK